MIDMYPQLSVDAQVLNKVNKLAEKELAKGKIMMYFVVATFSSISEEDWADIIDMIECDTAIRDKHFSDVWVNGYQNLYRIYNDAPKIMFLLPTLPHPMEAEYLYPTTYYEERLRIFIEEALINAPGSDKKKLVKIFGQKMGIDFQVLIGEFDYRKFKLKNKLTYITESSDSGLEYNTEYIGKLLGDDAESTSLKEDNKYFTEYMESFIYRDVAFNEAWTLNHSDNRFLHTIKNYTSNLLLGTKTSLVEDLPVSPARILEEPKLWAKLFTKVMIDIYEKEYILDIEDPVLLQTFLTEVASYNIKMYTYFRELILGQFIENEFVIKTKEILYDTRFDSDMNKLSELEFNTQKRLDNIRRIEQIENPKFFDMQKILQETFEKFGEKVVVELPHKLKEEDDDEPLLN